MKAILLVSSGGALGAVFRYLISQWMKQYYDDLFPWHTLAINVSGCLLMGIAFSYVNSYPESTTFSLFFMVGVLGGFTTFSAFGLETIQLIKASRYAGALGYVVASTLLGVLGILIGYELTQKLIS